MVITNGMGTTLAGVPIHGIDPAGVRWKTSEIDGWWAAPGSTGELSQRPYRNGGWPSEAFEQSKVLVVGGTLYASDRPTARAAVEKLMAALPLDDPKPLVVHEDGLERHALVRQGGTPIVKWTSDRSIKWDLQLEAPDGRRFSGNGSGPSYSTTTYLPEVSGGLTAPFTAPFTVPGVVTSGSVTITNAGTAETPVKATMYGPLDNPVLRSGDRVMRFNLSLGPNDFLVVDLDARTVKLNGQATRRGRMSGSWITVKPGDTLSFESATYAPTARMVVEWSDSWR